MATIFWKELADHLGSKRFFILSLIILVVAGNLRVPGDPEFSGKPLGPWGPSCTSSFSPPPRGAFPRS
jgi:membrane associated rhomboid family serine protease